MMEFPQIVKIEGISDKEVPFLFLKNQHCYHSELVEESMILTLKQLKTNKVYKKLRFQKQAIN